MYNCISSTCHDEQKPITFGWQTITRELCGTVRHKLDVLLSSCVWSTWCGLGPHLPHFLNKNGPGALFGLMEKDQPRGITNQRNQCWGKNEEVCQLPCGTLGSPEIMVDLQSIQICFPGGNGDFREQMILCYISTEIPPLPNSAQPRKHRSCLQEFQTIKLNHESMDQTTLYANWGEYATHDSYTGWELHTKPEWSVIYNSTMD